MQHNAMRTEAAGAVRATTATALPEGGPALPPRVSWGAVLAGGIAAAAIAATLNILGAAIGATAVDAVGRATPGASSLGIGAAAWMVAASTAALAVGGYTAARLSGTADDTHGVLHGLAVWAIALLVSAAPLGGPAANLVSLAASTLSSAAGGAAGSGAPYVSAAEDQANPSATVDRATDTPRGTGGEARQMSTDQRAAEMSSLLAGRAARGRGSFTGEERARLDALVAAEAGVSAEEAGRRVQAVKADAQRTATEAARRAREARDARARVTLIGVLGTCAALPLGAIAAVFGARRGTRDRMARRPAPMVGRGPARAAARRQETGRLPAPRAWRGWRAKRMARPVCKRLVRPGLSSLR